MRPPCPGTLGAKTRSALFPGHRFINASDTSRMRIFWIYASVDATCTIVATGETRSIDSERV
jgi:hypothetical protein